MSRKRKNASNLSDSSGLSEENESWHHTERKSELDAQTSQLGLRTHQAPCHEDIFIDTQKSNGKVKQEELEIEDIKPEKRHRETKEKINSAQTPSQAFLDEVKQETNNFSSATTIKNDLLAVENPSHPLVQKVKKEEPIEEAEELLCHIKEGEREHGEDYQTTSQSLFCEFEQEGIEDDKMLAYNGDTIVKLKVLNEQSWYANASGPLHVVIPDNEYSTIVNGNWAYKAVFADKNATYKIDLSLLSFKYQYLDKKWITAPSVRTKNVRQKQITIGMRTGREWEQNPIRLDAIRVALSENMTCGKNTFKVTEHVGYFPVLEFTDNSEIRQTNRVMINHTMPFIVVKESESNSSKPVIPGKKILLNAGPTSSAGVRCTPLQFSNPDIHGFLQQYYHSKMRAQQCFKLSKLEVEKLQLLTGESFTKIREWFQFETGWLKVTQMYRFSKESCKQLRDFHDWSFWTRTRIEEEEKQYREEMLQFQFKTLAERKHEKYLNREYENLQTSIGDLLSSTMKNVTRQTGMNEQEVRAWLKKREKEITTAIDYLNRRFVMRSSIDENTAAQLSDKFCVDVKLIKRWFLDRKFVTEQNNWLRNQLVKIKRNAGLTENHDEAEKIRGFVWPASFINNLPRFLDLETTKVTSDQYQSLQKFYHDNPESLMNFLTDSMDVQLSTFVIVHIYENLREPMSAKKP